MDVLLKKTAATIMMFQAMMARIDLTFTCSMILHPNQSTISALLENVFDIMVNIYELLVSYT